ncbi:putative tumor protein 63-like [Scophthalmus maximus]|uniref:Putative tumor protein 63-like n=1 Tax=Scophthalmus maximus TaxID=52904 RepID=A0A2U9C5I7_SCOMX|nr:putative tumor protein 63-like [Scophthalmus maximus]
MRHFSKNNGALSSEAGVMFQGSRLRDPSSRMSWREGSFLTAMSQNQSAQTSDLFSQDVFNQLFDMLDQSAIHSVQPIELNFTDSATNGSAGNTIQISMDCITMHKPDETLSAQYQGRRAFHGPCE